ncbi:cellulase [Flammeovirga pectinis]|uniref:Endoglucanase n=1 Tax=Flammeovirga pectinis TaxID=2494373 RepID=A0A3S9PA10_9BACT|nr:glycoside hydrolase family 9 protein [Flammeovirga pectinis]AZQ64922.1 cellulase [Flammeovirga pectinis]
MKLSPIVLSIICLLFLSCSNSKEENRILINQEGYYRTATKIITVKTDKPAKFLLLSADKSKDILKGDVTNISPWKFSGETYGKIDLSSFKEAGAYVVWIEDIGYSDIINIKDNLGEQSLATSVEAYYLQRCSSPIEKEYAGIYAREGGHPDDKVLIHSSALNPGQDPKTTISSPKGWYDAGDYNKYIVNSGITTYTLLLVYKNYADILKPIELKIPVNNKNLPLYLDNIKWNLDWMFTMQDPLDGGVYHKLTNASFDGMVMPAKAQKKSRYVVQKSTAAALNFAAVFFHASRVFSEFDKTLAEDYKLAAIKALDWAEKNPSIIYDQVEMNKKYSPKITTGAYDDKNLSDEFIWAYTEAFLTTLDDTYYTKVEWSKGDYNKVPSWSNVEYLAIYSLLTMKYDIPKIAQKDFLLLKKMMTKKADVLASTYKSSAMSTSMGATNNDFVWGSNAVAANHAMFLLQAYAINFNKEYIDTAIGAFDFVMGRNPLDMCFLTGSGKQHPMHIHHRLSDADKIKEPLPGLLVGGPQNENNSDNCGYNNEFPATTYKDVVCSFTTNEIAINWNAPFVYMMAGLESHYGNKIDPLAQN